MICGLLLRGKNIVSYMFKHKVFGKKGRYNETLLVIGFEKTDSGKKHCKILSLNLVYL